jgi:hypothetical protein
MLKVQIINIFKEVLGIVNFFWVLIRKHLWPTVWQGALVGNWLRSRWSLDRSQWEVSLIHDSDKKPEVYVMPVCFASFLGR